MVEGELNYFFVWYSEIMKKINKERSTGPNMGLWIDHKKAIIVTLTGKDAEIGLVVSKVEKQLQRSGDSPLKGSYEVQKVPAEDSRQRRLTGNLNVYYDEVVTCLRSAGAILIFGPGEAKVELKKRLVKNKLGGLIAGVETLDKITNRQLVVNVRESFTKLVRK